MVATQNAESAVFPFPGLSATVLVPPLNFALAASGVYRSGCPNRRNHAFLETLSLKCIIYLCPDEYSDENKRFFAAQGIRVMQYKIKGNKDPFQTVEQSDVANVLGHILEPENRPILVHCNKGKHRVGCVIGCLRKLQGWPLTAIFDECRRFSGDKVVIADQELIELFDLGLVAAAAKRSGIPAIRGVVPLPPVLFHSLAATPNAPNIERQQSKHPQDDYASVPTTPAPFQELELFSDQLQGSLGLINVSLESRPQ